MRTRLAPFVVATLVLSAPAAARFSAHLAPGKANAYLKRQHSPLVGLGTAAIREGLACPRPYDGRLILAITGIETQFGKVWGLHRPSGHNAWSWGSARYSSFREGLRSVGGGLCRGYILRGLTTIPAIGARYAPVGASNDPGGTNHEWPDATRRYFRAMGGRSVLVPARNAPTKQPPTLPPVRAHGRVVNTNCAHRTLVLNDRGRCVRALQWLLSGSPPAVRPAKKAHGVNADRRYWRIRSGAFGAYGHATVKQVQLAKWRLGYPSGQANGAAGPKLRRYLLGTLRLPASYRTAEANRYRAWKAANDKGAKLQALLADASYLLDANWRVHYTQTMTGPNGRMSLLLNHPRGPPIGGELYGDCSSTVEALYIWNGLPDPAGLGAWQAYPGRAVYTGTQAQHGQVVWRAGQSLSRLKPGDFLFYGPAPTFNHVAMYIGNGRVFSHGSEGCPCNNSALYRPDAVEARRYFG